MDNQHRQIKGYRDLSQAEIDLMNEIKAKANEVGDLVQKVQASLGDEDINSARAASIAKTDLQTGFMWLTRAVAGPGGF